jgi:S1-C subfamily serine protease
MVWRAAYVATLAVACVALSSAAQAQPTAQFDSEISTTYPFDTSASPSTNPSGPSAQGSKTTPRKSARVEAKPAASNSRGNTRSVSTPTARATIGPVIEDPWLRAQPSQIGVDPSSPRDAQPSRYGGLVASTSVPLVRVPWADAPMTLAAAQQDLSWRATLPSSGIAAWGINPVQNPERALVEVLVGGAVVGVGAVLEGGAVLTSLTVIGRGLEIAVRFSDGSTEAATVRRTHRAYDLALLEPAAARVRNGLPLARQVNDSLGLLFWSSGTNAHPPLPATKGGAAKPLASRGMVRSVPLQWFGASWGSDGVPIHGALRPPQLTELGTPLVNASGHLAALVTLACVVDEPRPSVESRGCRVTRVGLTSGTLGEFLGMVEKDSAQVWFGIIGETTDTGWARGVRITGLTAGSPAAAARLRPANGAKPADVIVAIDNTPIYEMGQLRAALRAQHPGSRPVLTVLRDGRLQQVTVSLPSTERPLPVAETPEPWVSF